MGGGGGAGITTNSTKMLGRPAADGIINGGPGGGIVFVRAGTITGSGSITAKGTYGSKAGDAGMVAAGLPHSGCTRSNVLIVKRITAIGTTRYTDIIDNPASASDNDSNWPTDYLKGKIDGANVKPNDEIEYTIYYLNTGNVAASSFRICDRLQKDLVFQTQFDTTNSATIDKGINLTLGTGITQYLTNNSTDTDRGFLSTSSTMPDSCNLSANATTAASLSDHVVVVDVAAPSNPLPGTISSGNPTNAYGYIQFKVKVKP